MTVNPIPPQAYTKDTMLKAYAWLQHQSANIKELATTPDILVSLFLKTTRDGENALDRPSIQNFKSELKSLAGLLGELEGARKPGLEIETNSRIGNSISYTGPTVTTTVSTVTPNSTPNPTPPAKPSQVESKILSEPKTSLESKIPEELARSPQIEPGQLDPASLEMIREVKNQLNLSNDSEALRAIIRLGHRQISRLFRE